MSHDRRSKCRSLPVLNEDPRGWECKAILAFMKLHSRLERCLSDGLSGHGMTLAQFDVLMTLWHSDGITQQELAEWLLVTKANVVGLIDRVSAAGWVERRRPSPAKPSWSQPHQPSCHGVGGIPLTHRGDVPEGNRRGLQLPDVPLQFEAIQIQIRSGKIATRAWRG